MDVGIDQARDDGAAAEMDDTGRLGRQGLDRGGVADCGDPAVAHGKRLGGRRVEQHHLAAQKDGVDRLSPCEGGEERQDGGKQAARGRAHHG